MCDPDSLYLPIDKHYQRRLTHSQEGAMPTAAYAKSVVAHVVARNPRKWVWEGKKSWIAWMVHQFLPKGIWVFLSMLAILDRYCTDDRQGYIFPRMFGLDVLKRIVYQQRREASAKKIT